MRIASVRKLRPSVTEPEANLVRSPDGTSLSWRIRTSLKTLFDRVAAALLILLLSPLLLLILVLIQLDSPGGPFFTQTRIGRHGKPFEILKFRTMTVEAPHLREEFVKDRGPERLVFKLKGDPRVTRLGRFLRKFSLDELPQLVNVVRGDMSLIGPRPLLLEDFEKTSPELPGYDKWYEERHRFRPGISGLWQVSGRNHLPFDKLMDLDVQYIQKWGLLFDLLILAKTPLAVLRGAD
jgi:lipopolysaccharide/colanic/teichoic acid biosynthesis glycosyltransferase